MAKLVSACDLPSDSRLHRRVAAGDFLDCYAVVSEHTARRAAEIATSFPRWASALLAVRNILLAPFGLKGKAPKDGNMIGIFPVTSESPDELIMGVDDAHLDFRIAVMQHNGHVYLATWVHRNTFFDRLYLTTIMPFHILIVRDALRRVARS